MPKRMDAKEAETCALMQLLSERVPSERGEIRLNCGASNVHCWPSLMRLRLSILGLLVQAVPLA